MHRSAYLLEPLEESRTCLAGSDQVPALIGRCPRREIPSSEYPLHFLQATDRAPAIRRGDSSSLHTHRGLV